jgi:putative transposase
MRPCDGPTARFAHRKVRSYEHTHTHALWHIDAYHCSIPLSHQGQMKRPALLAIIDDHARFICHAQWFWREDTAAAAHVFSQAIVKRGLPRMVMSDNGGPFVAAEIRHGLHRLGVLHETTTCYAPNQNRTLLSTRGNISSPTRHANRA